MTYIIRETPLDKLTIQVKELSGFKYDDRGYDKLNYARTKKSVKLIYDYFSEVQKEYDPYLLAGKAISDLVKELKAGGMSWSVEGVITKRIPDWYRQFSQFGKYVSYMWNIK